MNYIALQMLFGDRAKFFGLIFAIAFSSFLLANQSSIFAGIMKRTGSQIIDVVDADVWVMDSKTQYVEEVAPMSDNALYRVRSVPGVDWAAPLFKGYARARAPDGTFRQVILMGVDDASFAGVARKLVLGSVADLRRPDAIMIDKAGYEFFFPGERLALGRTLEMNDRRAVIVAISDASAPFATFPVVFSRYSEAVNLVGRERNQLGFVLVKAADGIAPPALAQRIARETGLKAATGEEFFWQTIRYYLKNTGIPVNFGITIVIALIVGTVVAGQTFYLFTLENLRQFGSLKAIGVGNGRLVGMILLQAAVVAAIGYSIGIGLCALFFEITLTKTATRGLNLLWQSAAGVGVAMFVVVAAASLLSMRRVITLEPAAVFRG